MYIYLASSWRNSLQPHYVRLLREAGYEVYDFRNPHPDSHGFSWSEVDPQWKDWTPAQFRHHMYSYPLNPDSPIARGFDFDRDALNRCDLCICLLPCGRSAHLEAGYCAGQGKPVIFHIPTPNGFEPKLMYLLGPQSQITIGEEELIQVLNNLITEQSYV